jgi:hypothetical protein
LPKHIDDLRKGRKSNVLDHLLYRRKRLG